MKTFMAKIDDVEKKWIIIDADSQILGRLSSQVAALLRGKHKPIFTPHMDTGDHVVVINADKIRLTGRKVAEKIYYHHTGFPGGLREKSAKVLIKENPERMIRLAIQGMLPKTSLRRTMLKNLRIYAGSKHPHKAQQPVTLDAVKTG